MTQPDSTTNTGAVEEYDVIQPLSGDMREWLILQLEQWPRRVNEQFTTSLTYLMAAAAATLRATPTPASEAEVPQSACLRIIDETILHNIIRGDERRSAGESNRDERLIVAVLDRLAAAILDGPEAATALKTLAAERDAALGELAEASEAIERLTVASGQLLHDAQAERQVREMAATSGGFYAATSRNMEQRATAAEAREETLAAENARLQVRIVRCESEVAATEDVGRVAVAAATKAEAENARLREALEHISEGEHDRRMTGQRERAYREALARAQGVARAALSPVTQVNEPRP